MVSVKPMTNLQKDVVASFLRSQLSTLQSVLETIENSDILDDSYVEDSLSLVEKGLRRIRKSYINN